MLWEIATGLSNDYNVLVPLGGDLECGELFRLNGTPLQWASPPKVAPYADPRRKRQKQRADIEYLIWGAIVLNERAYTVLAEFLRPFGELLLLDCPGEKLYFYNVTTLHSVVNYEQSGKIGKSVTQPSFYMDKIPTGICFFKDPILVRAAIYINDETKLVLEKLLDSNKLTGLFIGEAGKFLR